MVSREIADKVKNNLVLHVSGEHLFENICTLRDVGPCPPKRSPSLSGILWRKVVFSPSREGETRTPKNQILQRERSFSMHNVENQIL